MLPSLILSSQLSSCNGCEATLYSLFMSLINLGETIGILFGTFILHYFEVSETNYDNFYLAIIWKGLLRLLLILFVPLLAPDGTPEGEEDGKEE